MPEVVLAEPPVMAPMMRVEGTPREAIQRPWRPNLVLITRSARSWPHGLAMAERAAAMGASVVELPADRVTLPPEPDPKRAYRWAKTTLAIVTASAAQRRLQPIAPSADWRVDLAQGCPAHCTYCYLAGSLKGPPIIRAYANLPEILGGLGAYLGQGTITSRQAARRQEGTTFEASCYTDPLGIEHLTGSLAATVAHFGAWDAGVQLRFTTKYAAVEPLLALDHRGRTRARFSVNALPVTRRHEGGTAAPPARLAAMGRLVKAGWPVGLTIAPIMAFPGWQEAYDRLLADAASALGSAPSPDLTVELITHRFTPTSKLVLNAWYPGSDLEMDEAARQQKTTKFGSLKWVYPKPLMAQLRHEVEAAVRHHLPTARLLYWT